MRAGRAVVAIGVLGVVQQKQSWKMQHRTECPCRVSHDLISRPTPPPRLSDVTLHCPSAKLSRLRPNRHRPVQLILGPTSNFI